MAEKKKKEKMSTPPEGMSLLMTAEDKVEADVLETKLEAYGIPVARDYRENGAYLTIILGNTAFGIDMYVPAERLEEAKNIIADAKEIKDEDILSDPSFSDESSKQAGEELVNKLNRNIWWLGGLFLAAVAVLIYFILKG